MILDGCRLFHGDCLAVMAELPPCSVDAIIGDLPYGTTQNKWDSVIPLPALWAAIKRVRKPGAAVILTASQPFTSVLVTSNLAEFRHEWIWIKNRGSNFANTVREPMKEHESVLVFSTGKWTYNKQMQSRTGGGADRIRYEFGFRSETTNYGVFGGRDGQVLPELRVPSSWQKFNCEVGLHPTQKPTALMDYLVRTYTNLGDIVLDPTMGSGTTGVAALEAGRWFVGIERDEAHFETARKRILE